MALILDTGPLYAALDLRDGSHLACSQLIAGAQERLVIPEPVLVEVDYLLYTKGRSDIFLLLLRDITDGAYAVESLTTVDSLRIREICARYADSDVGFVDAAVLAVVERLGETKLATLDRRHFGLLRPAHVPALTLLPE